MEEVLDSDSDGSDSALWMLLDPSTISHLIFLFFCSGFLYVSMKVDFLGLELQGGVMFLSLSASYLFAAILAPSKIGKWAFMVNHNAEGVLNKGYWASSFFKIIPIFLVSISIWGLSNFAFEDEELARVKIILALLFILMSAFQAYSLSFGWSTYGKKKKKIARLSKSGGFYSISRTIGAVLIFSPLVWWFGYGAENPQNAQVSEHFAWFLFLFIIVFLSVSSDRYTRASRTLNESDGLILDRVYYLLFLTSCWHLLGAWRRSPFTAVQSTSGMLIEEGFFMSVTIILAVWSISNRGKKNGWRFFQGQSAVFMGIGFGFAYAGSISSLTALSEGSLLTTTAIGHMITAIVMIALIPASISWVGEVGINDDLEIHNSSVNTNEIVEDDVGPGSGEELIE